MSPFTHAETDAAASVPDNDGRPKCESASTFYNARRSPDIKDLLVEIRPLLPSRHLQPFLQCRDIYIRPGQIRRQKSFSLARARQVVSLLRTRDSHAYQHSPFSPASLPRHRARIRLFFPYCHRRAATTHACLTETR